MVKETRFGVYPAVALAEQIGKLFDSLTPRQLETLRYVTNGASYEEAGKQMGISVNTVDAQMGKIKTKIDDEVRKAKAGYVMARLVRHGVKTGQFPHDLPEGPYVPPTPQEFTVCGLIYNGKSNLEIASELVIERKTVEAHLSHVHEKLKVKPGNRLHTIARLEAMKNAGLLVKPQGRYAKPS